VDDLENYNVKEQGSAIRYSELYGKQGSNINFVKKIDANTSLRTYERGVEDETLACGTGATAVAIAMNATGVTDATSIDLNVEGGKLVVSFDKKTINIRMST
jgi:diaminopimelate epimerase